MVGALRNHDFSDGISIRITSLADNELMYSFDFELPGEPAQIAPFHTMKPQSNGNYFFDPNSFTENATDNSAAALQRRSSFRCYRPALFGNLRAILRARSAADRTSATLISQF